MKATRRINHQPRALHSSSGDGILYVLEYLNDQYPEATFCREFSAQVLRKNRTAFEIVNGTFSGPSSWYDHEQRKGRRQFEERHSSGLYS